MTTHPFRTILDEHKKLVQPVLFSYFNTPLPGLDDSENRDDSFHWEMTTEYSVRGGKYFRSTLFLLAVKALGGDVERALTVAAAIEASEEWLLMHDDIEDESLMRRGKPTLHRQYSPALAINAGDAMHVVMWQILISLFEDYSSEIVWRVQHEFSRILSRTILGQTCELQAREQDPRELTEEDYFYIVDGKTGYYSVGGPLRLAVLLSIEDTDFLSMCAFPSIAEFAVNLGRVFQICNDVHDLMPNGIQREIGSDLYEGKLTLMVVHALRCLPKSKREHLSWVQAAPRRVLQQEDVEIAIGNMLEAGSLDYARMVAYTHAEEALNCLAEMDFFPESSVLDDFEEAVSFILNWAC